MKSKAFMSQITMKQANRLAYKDMNTVYYVLGTMTMYAGVLLGAIFIYDITTIFDFAAAIAISCISFLFPGWFYILAVKQFGVKVENHTFCSIWSWIFLVLAFLNFTLGMFSSIYGVIEQAKDGEK